MSGNRRHAGGIASAMGNLAKIDAQIAAQRDPLAPPGYFMDAQDNVFVCLVCRQDKDRGHKPGCQNAEGKP